MDFTDYLIAVGGWKPKHAHTELLSRSGTWSVEDDYPYDIISKQGEYIIDYSIVALDHTFFIFGGDAGDLDFDTPMLKAQYAATNTIAAFSTITKQWKKIGKLNNARYSHGVFLQKGAFVIFGGVHGEDKEESYSGPIATERCILNGYTMYIECEDIGPYDVEGYVGPEMMAVHADYCKI